MSLPSTPAASLVGKAKLKEVTSMLAELRKDLTSHHLTNEKRKVLLEQLKVYGRNRDNSDPIYTQNGIETLAKQGFEHDISAEASREAMSCLANALLLEEPARQLLADLDIFDKATEKLKSGVYHDEFLVSRILFLEAYGKSVDFDKLARNGLADVLNEKLQAHASRYNANQGPAGAPMADAALAESAKLVFTITTTTPETASLFSPSAEPLFSLLTYDPGTPPLQLPFAQVLSALLNLDTEAEAWKKNAFPEKPTSLLETLISLLRSALKHYPEEELNKHVSPIIALLHKLYESAADAEKGYMRTELLPSDADRAQVLGKSDSLASHLLRLSVSPLAPELREAVSTLEWVMSGCDPDAFVHNVGFGYASGFLMNRGMALPTGAGVDTDDSGAEINPVTGQRLDAEPKAEEPNMTDEEKEREAERLFVLFDRLKKTGIIDVVNPVQRAVDEGRFEELPD